MKTSIKLVRATVTTGIARDSVEFLTNMVGPTGDPVKLTATLPFGQGLAWVDSLGLEPEQASSSRKLAAY